MANVDRPDGFRVVKSVSGAPWNGTVRTVGVSSAADIFLGDALELDTGLARPLQVEGECIGVCVGFGKKGMASQ